MNQALTNLTRARIQLYVNNPMYGILAMRLVLTEDKSVATLAVDYNHIFYNPDYVLQLTPKQTMSAIAHEVLHCVYDHIERCGARNPRKWNVATDYVVNDALVLDGFELRPSWLHNVNYRGMTANRVYILLPDQPQSDSSGGGGHGSPQDVMLPGGSQSDNAAKAIEWKIATTQAAEAAKAAGKLPASMKRALDELLGNKVDWRSYLRRFWTETSKNDFSWSHPQRRMIPYGFILPGLHSLTMGVFVVVIDTSGSIDDYTLKVFGSEVIAARASSKPQKLIVIYCDAAVNRVDMFDEHETPTFKAAGGGGTDFRPPFTYLAKENISPACLVYLTDCEGPFPASPPPYPVLWVTTSRPPKWGESVRIEV